MESIVRMAVTADEPALLKHCQMHNGETGVYGLSAKYFPIDDDACLEIIRRGTQRQYGLIGVIGEPGAELEASICLVINKLWWTSADHCHIDELYTFVHPDHRKSQHAKALHAFAKSCSRELHIPMIGGLTANEQTESKMRLYKRNFGYPRGAYFVFNPEAPDEDAAVDESVRKFWRNPFPEVGVAVLETKGLPPADLAAIARIKNRVNGQAAHPHG